MERKNTPEREVSYPRIESQPEPLKTYVGHLLERMFNNPPRAQRLLDRAIQEGKITVADSTEPEELRMILGFAAEHLTKKGVNLDRKRKICAKVHQIAFQPNTAVDDDEKFYRRDPDFHDDIINILSRLTEEEE